MDDHHIDIIRLAWARELGLDDLALQPAQITRAVADVIEVIDIAGARAVVGPQWFLERTAHLDAKDLQLPATVLEHTHDHGGRIISHVDLAFLSDYTDTTPAERLLISHERDDAMSLATLCPPDDRAEADIEHRDRWFTALTDDRQPISSAGYTEFRGLLADLRTLTAPAERHRGIGGQVTLLAAEDALDAGLVPQLRVNRGTAAAATLARHENVDTLGIRLRVHVAPSW
ncbi:GNAT family acetyltransferase [Rhodococcus sp. 27YEA15]|uniref:GNAT family acetyltransferase n=1 Tax=Rhodococcus sp. 27YEA15 TaxID=3156259 RepID=UPI003C7DA945